MTREKAVNEYVIPALKNTWNEKVCAEVINALEQEHCEDCVSRQAVLMELDKYLCGVPFDEKGIDEVIKELPPVTPQPKTGHWSRKTKVDAYDIAGVKTWGIKCQCDRCDFTTIVVEDFGYYKYCPNCGARMAESEVPV